MDWQQDGPSQKGADQTNNGEHSEESQEEERVDRAIVEDVIIVDSQERLDPVKQSIGERGSRAPASGRLAKMTTHGVGRAVPRVTRTRAVAETKKFAVRKRAGIWRGGQGIGRGRRSSI